ncbi:MAG: tetratricopeptide repeat protein [Candidatus Omnitrophica bacterium]|nr:tetratricopeptide repeat protein [Candidatus Omnitrophota bacterium]
MRNRSNLRRVLPNHPDANVRAELTRSHTALCFFILTGAVLLAYLSSLHGAFIMDDIGSIVENYSLRHLGQPWKAFWAPSQSSLAGRPLANFSFALNYAWCGLNPSGYHAVNIFLHALSANLVFGILRHLFSSEAVLPWCRNRAGTLSFLTALLWGLHPLNTEAVSYIVQRTELLAGFFMLTTLYCAIRSFRTGSSKFWAHAAIISCAAGVLSKEIAATTPLLVWIYDAIFVSRSFRHSLNRRRAFYAALASTWILLGALLVTAPRSWSVRTDYPLVSPRDYWLTQSAVITHYLRLALWPHPLVIDYYDWPVFHSWAPALPYLGLVLSLTVLTAYFLVRLRPLGFAGAWFFLILAPTSSILPIVTEIAAERRMYLPLISIAALFMVLLARLGSIPRLAKSRVARAFVIVPLATALAGSAWATAHRNTEYVDEIVLWRSGLNSRPGNARMWNNLGWTHDSRGESEQARACYERAIAEDPGYPEAYNNMGVWKMGKGDLSAAREYLTHAIRIHPDYADACFNLGKILLQDENYGMALSYLKRAVDIKPFDPDFHYRLGLAMLLAGRQDLAEVRLRSAAERFPDHFNTVYLLGRIYLDSKRSGEALSWLEKAVALKPAHAEALNQLGIAHMSLKQGKSAQIFFRRAIQAKSEYADALYNLAVCLAEEGTMDKCVDLLKRAAILAPERREIQTMLLFIQTQMRQTQTLSKPATPENTK